MAFGFQSTPPLKRGGDVHVSAYPTGTLGFNPLHPSKGVETWPRARRYDLRSRFNPLHPSKGVETENVKEFQTWGPLFQSTPPLKRGGDVFILDADECVGIVSIHSTPQKGWRPPAAVSIEINVGSFNPLHPSKGVETASGLQDDDSQPVSIHSTPQKGWRHPIDYDVTTESWFQSTPPLKRGGDSKTFGRTSNITSFNPLHPSKGVETRSGRLR